MKLEKLTDVVNNPEHPIMQGVAHNAASAEGDKLICTNCGIEYTRGAWDFYQLCNHCFTEHDRKKMAERWKFIQENMK